MFNKQFVIWSHDYVPDVKIFAIHQLEKNSVGMPITRTDLPETVSINQNAKQIFLLTGFS